MKAHLPASTPAASPCVNICQMDAATGWCAGCLRTLDEIARWSALDEPLRHAVLAALPQRREQWRAERRGTSMPTLPSGVMGVTGTADTTDTTEAKDATSAKPG